MFEKLCVPTLHILLVCEGWVVVLYHQCLIKLCSKCVWNDQNSFRVLSMKKEAAKLVLIGNIGFWVLGYFGFWISGFGFRAYGWAWRAASLSKWWLFSRCWFEQIGNKRCAPSSSFLGFFLVGTPLVPSTFLSWHVGDCKPRNPEYNKLSLEFQMPSSNPFSGCLSAPSSLRRVCPSTRFSAKSLNSVY